MPTPSGFEAKSNAFNLVSSYCRAYYQRRKMIKLRMAVSPRCPIDPWLYTILTRSFQTDLYRWWFRAYIYTWTQTSATSALGIDFVSVWRSSSSFPTINSLTPPSLSCRPPGLKFKAQKKAASDYVTEKEMRLNIFFCISLMRFPGFTREMY